MVSISEKIPVNIWDFLLWYFRDWDGLRSRWRRSCLYDPGHTASQKQGELLFHLPFNRLHDLRHKALLLRSALKIRIVLSFGIAVENSIRATETTCV